MPPFATTLAAAILSITTPAAAPVVKVPRVAVAALPDTPVVKLPECDKRTRWDALLALVTGDPVCCANVRAGKKVVLGVGTLDELFEAFCLVQTHKITAFPIVLIGSKYWTGLVDWLRERMVEDNFAADSDLALLNVVDKARWF
mgnify:CR=1 FL=1